MLPMRPGQPARRSHGVVSLLAALDIATGCVIGNAMAEPKNIRKSLDEIEANVPDDLHIHLVMDNHATRNVPLIRNCLVKSKRCSEAAFLWGC